MRSKIVLIIVILVVVMILSGCFFVTPKKYPTYERELNEQDGVAVTIDGVKYVALPELQWREQRVGDFLGEAGGKPLLLCENDPERNFIFIWDKEFQPLSELHDVLLYRTDREIPPPSAESVDELYWRENNYRGEETIRDSKQIYDKEIIRALFDELEANKEIQVSEVESFIKFSMTISCYSEEVPGARYELRFGHVNGKLMVGNYFDGYVEFSLEVLERIAGHEIDLEWLIEWK